MRCTSETDSATCRVGKTFDKTLSSSHVNFNRHFSQKIIVESDLGFKPLEVKLFKWTSSDHRTLNPSVRLTHEKLNCFNKICPHFRFLFFAAVQNERQPRNTATIRPEALVEMDQERALREAAVAVGVFG